MIIKPRFIMGISSCVIALIVPPVSTIGVTGSGDLRRAELSSQQQMPAQSDQDVRILKEMDERISTLIIAQR